MDNKQTKRILQVITLSEWGGAQKQIFDLAMNFKAKGDEVAVAVGGDKQGELIDRLLAKKIKVYYLKYLQRSVNFYNDWLAFLQLMRVYKKYKPEIIHLHSSKAGALGAIAAKMAGVKKIVYTVHGLVLNEPLSLVRKAFYWLAEWLSAKSKNKIICVSKFDRQALKKYKLAGDKKIEVIHNGIDLAKMEFFDQLEARNKLSTLVGKPATEAKCLIGTIANFYPSKGLGYLIEAAREVKKLDNQIKFIIIGDGPERKRLEMLIKNYKLGETVFLSGRILQASRYLKAFDMFVLSSVKEGLAYTLIEAQAAGLPIIATKVGGNSEIIDDQENGILIPAGSYNILAERIVNLRQKTGQREELGAKAKIKAREFSLDKMMDKIEKVYLS